MTWGWGPTAAPRDPRPCPGAVAQGRGSTPGSEGDRAVERLLHPMDVVPRASPSSSHWAEVAPVPAPSQGCWVWTSPREQ